MVVCVLPAVILLEYGVIHPQSPELVPLDPPRDDLAAISACHESPQIGWLSHRELNTELALRRDVLVVL